MLPHVAMMALYILYDTDYHTLLLPDAMIGESRTARQAVRDCSPLRHYWYANIFSLSLRHAGEIHLLIHYEATIRHACCFPSCCRCRSPLLPPRRCCHYFPPSRQAFEYTPDFSHFSAPPCRYFAAACSHTSRMPCFRYARFFTYHITSRHFSVTPYFQLPSSFAASCHRAIRQKQ